MAQNRVTCPSCGAGLKLGGNVEAGTRIKCPKCASPFAVPEDDAESEAPVRRSASRFVDDDCDRESRPSKPKKKGKRKSAANSPPWGLIGGGVALLAAVVIGVLALRGAFSGKSTPAADESKDVGPVAKAEPAKAEPAKDDPAGKLKAAMQFVQGKRGRMTGKGTEVVEISLSGAKITDEDLDVLLWFPLLRNLDLDHTPITNAGLNKLKSIPKLTDLSVVGTGVTAEGAAAFMKDVPACTVTVSPDSLVRFMFSEQHNLRAALIRLQFWGGYNEKAVIRHIMLGIYDNRHAEEFKKLYSEEYTITDACMQYMRQLTTLETLDLGGPKERPLPITDAGLVHLKDHPSLKALEVRP